MVWIVMLNIAALLGVAAALAARTNRIKGGPPAFSVQPPQVYSNLPQVEKVDIGALFEKWAD